MFLFDVNHWCSFLRTVFTSQWILPKINFFVSCFSAAIEDAHIQMNQGMDLLDIKKDASTAIRETTHNQAKDL